jgi:ABC-type lipoprotein release transport system permease subunit
MRLFAGESRGSVEIVYIAMAVGVVLALGSVGLIVGSGLTESASDQVQDMEFEVVEPAQYKVKYTGDSTITGSDMSKLKILFGEGKERRLYNGTQQQNTNVTITQGDVVLNSQLADRFGVEYGDTIKFVAIDGEGNSFVADTVYIPPRDNLGGRAVSNGTISVEEDTNIEATVNVSG